MHLEALGGSSCMEVGRHEGMRGQVAWCVAAFAAALPLVASADGAGGEYEDSTWEQRDGAGKGVQAGPLETGEARCRGSRSGPVVPGCVFQDRLSGGGEGPAMVVVPAGRFHMGCLSDAACVADEAPVHEVVIAAPFALSVYEVTFEDYDRFSLPVQVDDAAWGRGRLPMINVSWDDAQDYAEWLSMQTGAHYRLPTEAEWEYAARAGTVTKYHWGDEVGMNRANCDGCGSPQDLGQTVPVGSFPTNGFGLHDMHGNVWEWVEDCLNGSYTGAPFDGSAWVTGDCMRRMVRGGSWFNNTRTMRAANRLRLAPHMRLIHVGFRVARTLTR